jgi:hypothetical protein
VDTLATPHSISILVITIVSNKWQSYIKVSTIKINLGRYDNYEEAVKVRKEAEVKYGYHPNHGKVKGGYNLPTNADSEEVS